MLRELYHIFSLILLRMKKKREMLLENFTEANKKVIVAAFSLRGKKIKPEKPKKKRSGMFMEALEAKQQAGK